MSTTVQTSKPGTGIIGPVRFAYLFVHEARVNNLEPNEPPKFETTLLIPKQANEFCPDPAAVLKNARGLVKDALDDFFGDKKPTDARHPVKDGDEPTSGGEGKFPGYWFIKTSAQYPPLLCDGYRNPVTDKDAWVSGDWGNVKIACFGYDSKGNKGVSVGLRGIQFTRKDEPFGSGGTSANEFDIVESVGGDPFED